MSIHWPIYRRLLARPTREVIVDDRRSYKAAEVVVASLHVADELERRCESPTVGALLPTSGAFPITALGAWATGKAIVPLNYLLKPDELQYVIDDSGLDTIFTAQPMLDFLGFTPRVKNLVMLEDINFKRVPSPRIPARAREHDLASLIYTSGTSGRPKGVMLSHGNLRANIRQIQQRVHFKTCNTMLGVLPQFHSFGLTVLTLVPLAIGPKVVYTARFAPGKIVGLIKEHQADTLVAIPSMYGALLTLKKATAEDFASLRYTVSGGEALPDALARRFKERFGQTINEGYGMTETAPVTNWCTPDIYKPHSVGPALPGVRQRIVDPETGADLPANTDGELRIAGPNVMRGYYNLPEVSEAAFDEQGYLRTGDMARVDDDGHVYITGRIKEMIIVGGENVFPREIEEVLNRHPSVHASGVTRLVDPVRGEVPVGFVETHEDADPETFDEKDIIRHCRESLAGYKVPRRIVRIDELPRNPTGKIMRRELEPLAAALAQPESAATR